VLAGRQLLRHQFRAEVRGRVLPLGCRERHARQLHVQRRSRHIDGEITAYFNWPVIAAIAPNISYPTAGLIRSIEPWSGAFSVGKQLWAVAHTAQFTQPGWTYVTSADGYLGGNRVNGSYVTLVPPSRGDFSTIVETTRASGPQLAAFTLSGGLTAPCGVHVWGTDLGNVNSASFVHTVGSKSWLNAQFDNLAISGL
jgi:hypothetical protein